MKINGLFSVLWTVTDDDFVSKLKENVEKHKNVPKNKCFWPTPNFRSRLSKRFNIKYKSSSTTHYNMASLQAELLPCLEMIFALRKIFKVPVGEGRILNIDESMTYRYDERNKSWTL